MLDIRFYTACRLYKTHWAVPRKTLNLGVALQHDLPFYIAYSVFASLAFFAPLSLAHTSMKKAKNHFITEISDQFEIELANIQTLLAGDNTKLKNSLSKLDELQKLYTVVSKFPVWPFNIGDLAGFFGAIISPFLVSLISIGIEQFFK